MLKWIKCVVCWIKCVVVVVVTFFAKKTIQTRNNNAQPILTKISAFQPRIFLNKKSNLSDKNLKQKKTHTFYPEKKSVR